MSDVDRYIVGAMFMTNAEYRGPKRMHERVVVLHTDHVAAIQAARADERERAAARVEEPVPAAHLSKELRPSRRST